MNPEKAQGLEGRLVVWINHRDGERCAGCGAGLDAGQFIQISREKGLRCLRCVGLTDLVFLGSGDAALTRRATAFSSRNAVVVKFSRRRKRNERQGILVEAGAIEKARESCLQDEARREVARRKRQARELVADEEYKKAFREEILRVFPSCPPEEAGEIARHACEKYSGRVGRSAAAREFDEEAIVLAVRARIRHRYTDYDELLADGLGVAEARGEVRGIIDRIDSAWRSAPPAGSPGPGEGAPRP
jgi:hypothetical protein